MTSTGPRRPYVLAAGQDRDGARRGSALKMGGDDTGGRFALLEHTSPKGLSAALHVHSQEDEAWWIVDGRLRFTIGDDDHRVERGAFLYVPRGVRHRIVVESDRATMLTMVTPAGLEEFLLGLDPDQTADELEAQARRYGVTMLERPGGQERP